METKPDYVVDNFRMYHCNGKGLLDYPEDVAIADIKVYVHDSCMLLIRNFPCPVCKVEHAVCDTNGMFMHPCRKCEAEGYVLVKKDIRPWWKKLLS